jgi:hypothetical protein
MNSLSNEEEPMEPAIEDLMVKIKAIAQGPNAELFIKLVDLLYEHSGRQEEYDHEPFSPEDLTAIKEGEEAFKRGEFMSLADYEKERGL